MTTAIEKPDEKNADALVKTLQIAPDGIMIKDEDQFIASWPIIQRHNEVIEKLTKGKDGFQGFDEPVNDAFKVHKALVALRAQFLNPVLASKKAWLAARVIFTEAAEKRVRAQREADAEKIRQADQKALLSDAKKFEKKGDVESATVLREQAAALPAPVLPSTPAVPKQAGSVSGGRWKYEIDNADDVPREFCDPTPSRINKVVMALGNKITIPGVRIFWERTESSRAVR